MSGHSKWANIKNRKGAQDKKRSEAFTKMSKGIMTAIRSNGGNTNPETNLSLKTAIDKAREVNMPKENIERLLKRFEERKNNLVSGMLEGYAPGNVPMMIEIETDNKNRTLGEIRNLVKNYEGVIGESGSVGFMFDKVGEVEIEGVVQDDYQLELIDQGAIDFEEGVVYTEASSLNNVVKSMELMGIKVENSAIVMRPKQKIMVTENDIAIKVVDLIDELEENEDVVGVYTGFDYNGEEI